MKPVFITYPAFPAKEKTTCPFRPRLFILEGRWR